MPSAKVMFLPVTAFQNFGSASGVGPRWSGVLLVMHIGQRQPQNPPAPVQNFS